MAMHVPPNIWIRGKSVFHFPITEAKPFDIYIARPRIFGYILESEQTITQQDLSPCELPTLLSQPCFFHTHPVR